MTDTHTAGASQNDAPAHNNLDAVIALARERVEANRSFRKHTSGIPRKLDELYDEHAHLADALESTAARLREAEVVIEKSYATLNEQNRLSVTLTKAQWAEIYFALWDGAEVGGSRATAADWIFSQVWGNQEAPHAG